MRRDFLRRAERFLYWAVRQATIPVRWVYNLSPTDKFTAVLCVVGGLQYWAFVKSERAFVAPASTDFGIKDTVGVKLLPMYLELRNSGKSTATIKELSAAISHEL